MRGALIHGVLLAVMLVYGYRTWTRDKTVEPNVGNVVLWDKTEADIVSIEYKSPKKIVKLERKPGGYWWGIDTTIETKAKPTTPKPADAGSAAGSGSAGSAAARPRARARRARGAGSGSAAPRSPRPSPSRRKRPVARRASSRSARPPTSSIKTYAAARALRDLGKPNDAAKKDYKLGTKPANIVTMKDGKNVSTSTITVTFKDGSRSVPRRRHGLRRQRQVRRSIEQTRQGLRALDGSALGPRDRPVEPAAHRSARLRRDEDRLGHDRRERQDARRSRASRRKGGPDGAQQVKTWGDPTTKKADQTARELHRQREQPAADRVRVEPQGRAT